MAAAVEQATGQTVTLIPGGRGIFEIAVDGTVVAQKTQSGFPDENACVRAVQEALAA